MMTVVGYLINKRNGRVSSTLFVEYPFEDFYKNSEDRIVSGKKCEAIYVGEYDISAIKIGSTIDIYYDKASVLPSGASIQKIKKIDIIK